MIGAELLEVSTEELNSKLTELQAEQHNLRFQKALQQLEGTHQLGQVKKSIARVKTLLRQDELGIRKKKV